MLRFAALNSDASTDSDAEEGGGQQQVQTREAQEGQAAALYRDALSELAAERTADGVAKLRQLLRLDYVNEEDPEEYQGIGPMPTSLHLKYLALKNAGEAYLKLSKLRKAAKFFVKAMLIDGRDIPTWLKVGDIGLQMLNLQLARNAYEMAVQLKENHWQAVDRLISVTYIIGDYSHCLEWCRRAIAGGSRSARPIVLADRIFEEIPFIIEMYPAAYRIWEDVLQTCNISPEESEEILEECESIRAERQDFQNWLDEQDRSSPPLKLRKVICEPTWAQLGEVLQTHYDNIAKSENPCHMVERIDFGQVDASRSLVEKKRYRRDSSSSEEGDNDGDTRENDDPEENNQDDEDGAPQSSGFDYKPIDPEENSDSQINDLSVLIGDNTPTDSLLDDLGISVEDSRSQRRKRVFQDFISSNKRRSARNRQGGKKTVDLNVNYRDLLIPFLPTSIFAECPVIEGESDGGTSEENGQSSSSKLTLRTHPEKIMDLRENETNDVKAFIARHKDSPAIEVMLDYLKVLAQKDEFRWPSELKGIFMALYERLRHNYQRPDDNDTSRTEEVLSWAWVELNVCELFLERYVQDNLRTEQVALDDRFPITEFMQAISFVCKQTHRRVALSDRWQVFTVRAFHVEACFLLHYGEISMARHRLEQVCVVMEQAKLFEISNDKQRETQPIHCVRVVNLKQNNLISAKEAAQLLDGIDRLHLLADLENLYASQHYERVVELITESLKGNRRAVHAKTSVLPRYRQLLLLNSALKQLQNDKDHIYWVESCIHECLNQYVRAQSQSMKTAWSETTVQLIDDIYEVVEKSPNVLEGLSVEKMSRFAHTLIKIISLQMDLRESVETMAIPTVLSWNLLYRIVKHEEDKVVMEKSADSAMPSSLLMMFTAHEYLGKRNWCMRNDGAFVFLCVRVMTEEMVNFRETLGCHPFEEDLTAGLEQCFHCLFVPDKDKTKKKGQVQDHNVKPLKLTWEHAKYVFTFYKPTRLPEFDSYAQSISAEAESLFRRIASLIPAESNPAACADRMAIHIESSSAGPMPYMGNDCPDKELISELYYLLGDFYFKNRDFVKASRHYMLDSCINPHRIDSWAGMALSRSAQIEQRLNSCELKGEGPQLLKRTDGAVFCFQKALELAPANASLWIECGSCAYWVVSFLCRQMKLRKALELSSETVAEYKRKKVEYLNMAKKCYTEAICCENEGNGNDELWLCHYMLSKITHKMGEPLEVYLEHISRAAQNLYEMKARYPKKVIYQTPAHLSIEALEMHYKVHAFAAKFLIKNQHRQISPAELQILESHLREASEGHFARHRERLKEASVALVLDGDESDAGSRTPKRGVGRPPKKSNFQEESEVDAVSAVMEELLTAVEASIEKERRYQDMSEYDSLLEQLFNYCLDAFRECIFRFSAHFKSVYHMANLYFRYKRHRDPALALDFLVAKQSRPPKLCTQGLFAERRASCLFQGVWHIPADEIDRPGSFATHLYRAARLTQIIAASQQDHEVLIQVALMLAKTPDMERKYIRDFDRSLVSRTAFKEGVRIVQRRFSSLMNEEPPPPEKTLVTGLVDIYRVWQQCSKSGSYLKEIEAVFKESYTLFKLGELDKTPSVVEQAASFCSKYLLREARKEKLAQQEAQRLAKLAKEMAVKAAQEAAKQAQVAAHEAQMQAMREQFEQQQALIEEMEKAAVGPSTTVPRSPVRISARVGPSHPESPSPPPEGRKPESPCGPPPHSSDSSPTKQSPPKTGLQTMSGHPIGSVFEGRSALSPPRPPSSTDVFPPMSPTVASSIGVMAMLKEYSKEKSPPKNPSRVETDKFGQTEKAAEAMKVVESSPNVPVPTANTTTKLPTIPHLLEGLAADIHKKLIESSQRRSRNESIPPLQKRSNSRAGGSSGSSPENEPNIKRKRDPSETIVVLSSDSSSEIPSNHLSTSVQTIPEAQAELSLNRPSTKQTKWYPTTAAIISTTTPTPNGISALRKAEIHARDSKEVLTYRAVDPEVKRVMQAATEKTVPGGAVVARTGLAGPEAALTKTIAAAAFASARATTLTSMETARSRLLTSTPVAETAQAVPLISTPVPTGDKSSFFQTSNRANFAGRDRIGGRTAPVTDDESNSGSDCVVIEPSPLPPLAQQLQNILPKGVTLTRCAVSTSNANEDFANSSGGSGGGGGGGSSNGKKDRNSR
ncbi:calcineurin-binding protein cabin-1-like isoform X3 [Varroa jacobsoni]|uniref:Calcineurin-binding protein cabin-1 n=1 Tax=Varroa destructor TaxID=109461 RepID=A0A7M7KMK9_VARDE|nr:calcineurin-binding protein cabin-1-like isoform X3 [Varroa destructor]XP_022695574.1 calcineurin-binding protein cabin-1-like isoform X3 [Varroa jacobsoni]